MKTTSSLRLTLPLLCAIGLGSIALGDPLPGTQALEATGDLSAKMVEGIDHWLVRETAKASEERARAWQVAAGDRAKWNDFAKARREELRQQLGMVDQRTPGLIEEMSVAGKTEAPARGAWSVEQIRWPVFSSLHGEGVLFRPSGAPRGIIIDIPDADQIPEEAPEAAHLAAEGWLVFAPVLVDRRDNWSGSDFLQRYTNEPGREWIYRQCFELGRTPTGYEAEKVLALVDDLLAQDSPFAQLADRVGIMGHGEGGLIAFVCAALDERLKAAAISGYFGPHDDLYAEPIYRNAFNLHRICGNAEMAALLSPRPLFIDPTPSPKIDGPPAPAGKKSKSAAPGVLAPFTAEQINAEKERANTLLRKLGAPELKVAESRGQAIAQLGAALAPASPTANPPSPAEAIGSVPKPSSAFIDARQERTIRELEAFNQGLIPVEEEGRTTNLWAKTKPGVEWDATQRALHERLSHDCIGKIDAPYLAANPRTRLLSESDKVRVYEVMLDVFPDVYAWGYLLVPKNIKPGERRPVVVCQHGLEGVPGDTVTTDEKAPGFHFYKGFATRLAEQGFVTYAPHNPYRGQDKFRVLQRRANPLGLSLFSFIIAQHDVMTNWLAGLPFVDPQRIGFYGLSYGGKTAMRVPALVDRYCLSICSGDFNEWVRKNVSVTYRGTYVPSPEYEMPEWNLANVANYAEMAMLIAPRPFMVERGHNDGVGLDEWVGYEFSKVKRGYDKLGIGDRTEIEWFEGPHTIHSMGTFEFLHRHLHWAAW